MKTLAILLLVLFCSCSSQRIAAKNGESIKLKKNYVNDKKKKEMSVFAFFFMSTLMALK